MFAFPPLLVDTRHPWACGRTSSAHGLSRSKDENTSWERPTSRRCCVLALHSAALRSSQPI